MNNDGDEETYYDDDDEGEDEREEEEDDDDDGEASLRGMSDDEHLAWLVHAAIFAHCLYHICVEERTMAEAEAGVDAAPTFMDAERASKRSSTSASSKQRHQNHGHRSESKSSRRSSRRPPEEGEGGGGGGGGSAVDPGGRFFAEEASASAAGDRSGSKKAPPTPVLTPSLRVVGRTVLLMSYGKKTTCFDGIVHALVGKVLLHPFIPDHVLDEAAGVYHAHLKHGWVRRILRENSMLLPRSAVDIAVERLRRGNVNIRLLGKVIREACNDACRCIPETPAQRFATAVVEMHAPRGSPVLVLYPAHLEGSVYALAEGLKTLSGTLDIDDQLTCVRLQQKLMSLHYAKLDNTLCLVMAHLAGDKRVRKVQDVSVYQLKIASLNKECDRRAADLIADWHSNNLRVRALLLPEASPSGEIESI